MEDLLKEIKALSDKEEKTVEQMVLKLAEEVGETSQAVLSHNKAKGSEYKELNIQDVKEECVDVLLVTMSLFYKICDNEQELESLLKEKILKWKSHM
ncbi:MazG-like family protein [Oceanobacillus neutriphilus]|uniref:NTP pyrophosphohydrolase MazG putative catalytic core domain-containing protein n=1 Tax=Oceanobacillus neutriphilus TaxID=531815 RepID=A0ABQ2NUT2_9BACI|nr:MazG-like family protein [Oceanobacillus neutriphilus]GGP11038.1 hypothetical protein GCM10011346_21550 [Oceanobacillus neutriphilus]